MSESKSVPFNRIKNLVVVTVAISVGLAIVLFVNKHSEIEELQKAFKVVFDYSHEPKMHSQENFEDIDTQIKSNLYGRFYSNPIAKLRVSLTCVELEKAFYKASLDGKVTSNEFKEHLLEPIIECFERTYDQSINI